MSYINYSDREINLKVVLIGGWDRKPSVAEAFYNEIPPEGRGKLTTLEGKGAKALFFDFLPEDTPPVRGFCVRLQIYGWAGDPPGEKDIKLLLRGADGAVLFGNPEPLKDFIKACLEEWKTPWIEAGEDDNPVKVVGQLVKKSI